MTIQKTFNEQITGVCDVYAMARSAHENGVHIVSTDEMTGIQALERAHPNATPWSRASRNDANSNTYGTGLKP